MKKPTPTQQAKAALDAITKKAGNRGELALALGCPTRTTAYSWEILPTRHLRKACEIFNKKPKQLRPDLTDIQLARIMADAGAEG